ncbi:MULTISPECIES: DUF6777 domain-containing protein [unclassified Streptomyces]|uniref:DUF6777 domain-containing protein n=1 Tax=unclassified Streptomyces TaxID=2593676 RepID=UPI001371FE30|nr:MULTISPECIES: DUF6777 domain-containing protein [unclassified Streptomyces]NDZ99463.1 hypothetical protein [Streptomyces sp. SID10116]MYY84094.1 hypothetical protein [Streptomyces sp. SID335]MYZ18392.1 hypothetical protein [Streptomyces sp. SID337]NDZ89211.1 hypothetical protein [Streptomyces sp. SID10115]NEB42855.1 hypothetical protein [Streptomyces sp. SID339]
MRTSTRTHAIALAISAALAVAGAAGCSGDGDKKTADGGSELFMQPAAAQGPDPFTESTAETDTSPPPVTRSPQPSPTGSATPQGTRSIPGGTPGLYGGTHNVGSCDIDRQVRFLTADQGKARAFARAAGIEEAAVPDYLRGLTPVVLRADTRVTNHGYRGGSPTSFQSVLQTGTAVLVDDRGLPRVRCACGNPLKPPVAFKSSPRHNGQAWRGYQPTRVVVVTPAPRPIVDITIVNIVNNTWIERKIGDGKAHHDRPTKPPTPTPTPTTPSPTSPSPSSPTPTDPDETTPDETEPDETSPDRTSPDETGSGQTDPDGTSPDETSPDETSPDGTSPDGTSPDGTSPGESSPDEGAGDSPSACPTGTGTPPDPASPVPSGCPSPVLPS